MTTYEMIEDKMLEMGFTPGVNGFYSLAHAVNYFFENPEKVFFQTKISGEIYPYVGQKMGITASAAERNIRHLIESSIYTNPNIFGNLTDMNKGKVTNSTAISYLLILVKREIGSNEI